MSNELAQLEALLKLLPKDSAWTSIIVALVVMAFLAIVVYKIIAMVRQGSIVVNVRLSEEDIKKIRRETCPKEKGDGIASRASIALAALFYIALGSGGCTPATQRKADVAIDCIVQRVVPAVIECASRAALAQTPEKKK
jgi:hypothetical protein